MNDQCRTCNLRGDMKKCESVPCFNRDNWYAQEIIKERDALKDRLARIDAERGKEAVAWFAFADNNGPVPLELWGFDEKACKYAVLENARSIGWKGTIEGYLLHMRWTIRPLVFPAPQPPAPCPRCAARVADLFSEQHKVDALLAENDKLQAKVAEQSAEIGRLNRGIEVYTVQFELECQTTDRQSALIKELTETRDALLETQRALCNRAYERYMLIEQCEKFAADIPGNGSLLGFVSESARIEVLAAIAAHRSKP